ncbi:reverse transcriptase domain-containing protein [Clostridium sp.]|uniref:reverse transcriptase domain-containing protein n=1 Tax=Clostridium sp. TaxID=1506 RepID=UPI003F6680C5
MITPSLCESLPRRSTDLEKHLNALVKNAYPIEDAIIYISQLRKTYQKDFRLIKDYHTTITNITTKLRWALGLADIDYQARIAEYFYHGLDYTTKLEMAKLNLKTTTSIMEHIQEVEKTILNLVRDTSDTYRESSRDHTKHMENRYKGPYCKYHKTSNHSTEECRVLAKKDNHVQNHSQPRNFVLKEPDLNTNLLQIEGKLADITTNFTIDTGATRNFINEGFLLKNNLETIFTEPSEVTYGNGQTHTSTKCVKNIIKQLGNKIINKPVRLTVIKNLPEDIILGNSFLKENNAIINFTENTLQLEETKLLLNNQGKTDWINSPDYQLLCKTDNPRNGHLSKDIPESIKNIIQKTIENNPELGTLPSEGFRIPLSDDAPVFSKPYPMPYNLHKAVKEEIDKLIKLKVIRKSRSLYASPAWPILKKNGKVRLVVDYKKLNAKTVKQAFPFPNIREQLQTLPSANLYSQLDLNMGYYQIPVHTQDIEKTAFVVPWGHYEFLRMPFGLTSAPREFQRCMSNLLADLSFVRIFLDDVLIFSKSETEHATHLKAVFEILTKAGASINFDKSSFCQKQVTYLGNIISTDGIKADVSRVDNCILFKTPKSRKDIMKLVGFINWFRPYIPGLSYIIAPITEKLSKTKQLNWSTSDDNIIKKVVTEIKKQTLLSYPVTTQPFTLTTDASDLGLGAALVQENKLIGLYSHKFTKTERRYTIMEKELLAIIKAITHFKNIIFNSPIIIRTDNANITYLKDSNNSRVQRWRLLLEEFDYKITYIKGTTNKAADHISRCFLAKSKKEDTFHYDIKTIRNLQVKDGISQASNDPKSKKLRLHESKIYVDNQDRIFIPDSYANTLLVEIHKYLGHPGLHKQLNTIRNYLLIPQCKSRIYQIIKSCRLCQTNKIQRNNYGKLVGFLSTSDPFKNISTDIFGPVETDHFAPSKLPSKIFILTVIDRASRWTELGILTKITAEKVVETLKKIWLDKHPKPSTILSDRGKQYTSVHFRTTMKRMNIDHFCTTPYNPTGNSLSERINQTLGFILRNHNHESIHTALKIAKRSLNYTYHRVIGISPYEYLYKHSTLDPLNRNLEIDHKAIYNRMLKHSSTSNKLLNKSRITNYSFKENSKVYVKNVVPTSKMDSKWLGPGTIVGIQNDGNSFKILLNGRYIFANIKNIRPH